MYYVPFCLFFSSSANAFCRHSENVSKSFSADSSLNIKTQNQVKTVNNDILINFILKFCILYSFITSLTPIWEVGGKISPWTWVENPSGCCGSFSSLSVNGTVESWVSVSGVSLELSGSDSLGFSAFLLELLKKPNT